MNHHEVDCYLLCWRRSFLLVYCIILLTFASFVKSSAALEVANVDPSFKLYSLSQMMEFHTNRADQIRISAPGREGLIRRMVVTAEGSSATKRWAIFALKNSGNETLSLLLTFPRYMATYPSILYPDISGSRANLVTPSYGAAPEKIENSFADIFRLQLPPAEIITYVVELEGYIFPGAFLYQTSVLQSDVDKRLQVEMLLGAIFFALILIGCLVLIHRRGKRALLLVPMFAAIAIRWQFSNLLLPSALPSISHLPQIVAINEILLLISMICAYVYFYNGIQIKGLRSLILGFIIALLAFLILSLLIDPPLVQKIAFGASIVIGTGGLIKSLFDFFLRTNKNIRVLTFWIVLTTFLSSPLFIIAVSNLSSVSVSSIGLFIHLVSTIILLLMTFAKSQSNQNQFSNRRLMLLGSSMIGVLIIMTGFGLIHLQAKEANSALFIMQQIPKFVEEKPKIEPRAGEVIIKTSPLLNE